MSVKENERQATTLLKCCFHSSTGITADTSGVQPHANMDSSCGYINRYHQTHSRGLKVHLHTYPCAHLTLNYHGCTGHQFFKCTLDIANGIFGEEALSSVRRQMSKLGVCEIIHCGSIGSLRSVGIHLQCLSEFRCFCLTLILYQFRLQFPSANREDPFDTVG